MHSGFTKKVPLLSDNIFKCISWKLILIETSLQFVPVGSILIGISTDLDNGLVSGRWQAIIWTK